MNKSKAKTVTACIIGTFALIAAPAAPAVAATPDTYSEFRAGLEYLGIDAFVQDELVDRLTAGELIDSLDPAAAAISTESTTLTESTPFGDEGDNAEVSYYEDGSVSVIAVEDGLEVQDGEIAPADVNNCSVSGGGPTTVYSGCSVTAWWGTVQIGFNVSFQLVAGGNDLITATGDTTQQCVYPTTCSVPVTQIHRAQEAGAGSPAHARAVSGVTSPVSSWTVWVGINVGQDTYSSVSS
ncbi:MAG: hypothetical protein ACTH31_14785 [Pseudoclavibacter sp.]